MNAWLRSFTYHQSGRSRPRPEVPSTEEPEPDVRVVQRRRNGGLVLAVVAPLAVSVALVLLRHSIDRSTAVLILVLPVTLVAVLGGSGPSALAAVTAPLGFDVLHTVPYHRLEIHAAEDVEATLVLFLVGMLVGQIVARERRNRVRATVWGHQVHALLRVVQGALGRTDDELASVVAAELRELLTLRECRWRPGYGGGAYPLLGRTTGDAGPSTKRESALLPRGGVELPVAFARRTFGMFVLSPDADTLISREERLVANALADVMAMAFAARTPNDQRAPTIDSHPEER